MARKLVTVQKILSVEPIEGSDFIEKIKVLGWQCVAKKGAVMTYLKNKVIKWELSIKLLIYKIKKFI